VCFGPGDLWFPGPVRLADKAVYLRTTVIVFCNFDEGPLDPHCDGDCQAVRAGHARTADVVEPVPTRCRQDLAWVMSACPYRQLCVVVPSNPAVLGSMSGKPTPPSWLLFHMCWDAAPRGPFDDGIFWRSRSRTPREHRRGSGAPSFVVGTGCIDGYLACGTFEFDARVWLAHAGSRAQ
jgi:hypothetical protein